MFADNSGEKKEKFLSKESIRKQGEESEDAEKDIEGAVRIMPFNMDDELEEGKFDENFNFVRDRDEHESHDKWLGGISNADIRKAKAANERLKARVEAQDALEEDGGDEHSCWKSVLRLMLPRESVASGTTLKRLGGPKKVPAWKKNLKKKSTDKKDASVVETADAQLLREKGLSELITVTDRLTSLGRYDVMEQTYESIVRVLRIAGVLSDDWQHGDPVTSSGSSRTAPKLLWEYKFGQDSEVLYGPFPAAQMKVWKEQGDYFSIQLRKEQESDTNSQQEADSSAMVADDNAATAPSEEQIQMNVVFVRLVSSNTPLDPFKGFVPLSSIDVETGGAGK
ncbi:hypothetical protein BDR26DRAFT_864538 [Obelidium mucronatum]|nr:hypothetical protein BDR26DRAFT_864538 [Obelidium mucronatum]